MIERAVILSPGEFVEAGHLPSDLSGPPPPSIQSVGLTPGMTVDEAERRLIELTLAHTRDNKTRAAEILGVTVKTLHHYDRVGLLRPSLTPSGHRVYGERDLERLEQIVALKFLGLTLAQTKQLLERNAPPLRETLRLQRRRLAAQRLHLDRAIVAIREIDGTAECVQSIRPVAVDQFGCCQRHPRFIILGLASATSCRERNRRHL